MAEQDFNIDVLEGEICPFCRKKTLTLRQAEREIPYFGNVLIFSMDCEDGECGYHKADVESTENRSPVRHSLQVESEDDLRVRVVKSSFATIKIPHIGSIEPGEASNGYVTNVEGIISRIKKQVEFLRENAEEDSEKKKAKNMLKKINKVLWGQEKITINLDDPTGNSAIISEKVVKK
jgi:zinc finger protein